MFTYFLVLCKSCVVEMSCVRAVRKSLRFFWLPRQRHEQLGVFLDLSRGLEHALSRPLSHDEDACGTLGTRETLHLLCCFHENDDGVLVLRFTSGHDDGALPRRRHNHGHVPRFPKTYNPVDVFIENYARVEENLYRLTAQPASALRFRKKHCGILAKLR